MFCCKGIPEESRGAALRQQELPQTAIASHLASGDHGTLVMFLDSLAALSYASPVTRKLNPRAEWERPFPLSLLL